MLCTANIFRYTFSRNTHGLVRNFSERSRAICDSQTKRVEETLRSSGILTSGQYLRDFMEKNKLADRGEDVYEVFQRATTFLADAGKKFYGAEKRERYREEFLDHVCNFKVILGSPILTNAGRREKSISACSIPAVNLLGMSRTQIAKIVGEYHTRGMGTGFCLDELENPIEMVKYLNQLAISEVQRGQIERSVGNMGVLSIDHPKVLDFIRVKKDHPEIKEWKFNLSVNVSDEFMFAWTHKLPFTLKDTRVVNPEELMIQIAESSHATGDPGLIFMDRINQANRVPQMGQYKTVVPCGEVALFEGEVCQFSYLNIPRFLKNNEIDLNELRIAIHATVALLDNSVEANIERMPNEHSANMVFSVRRIGIGICGFAEVLHAMGVPYSSEKARELAADLMSFINFESKWASIELAKERGPFQSFDHHATRKDLFIKPFAKHPTNWVSQKDWTELERLFTAYKIRNLATTILPPTGRSSLMAGVTGSIEPSFRLSVDSAFKRSLQRQYALHGIRSNPQDVFERVQSTGSIQSANLPTSIKEVYKTALELSSEDHLKMTAIFQRHIDEGISKTVNISGDSTIDDAAQVFRSAYEMGLKGITLYRDGSRSLQPKALKSELHPMTSEKIIDSIYGPIEVSKKIGKLLTSPLLMRLKQVHQNGTNYLVDPRQSTTRYEHSLGALALAQMVGANESTQIAALLHDISHTAFSHVIDLVFAERNQNYHDRLRNKFLLSPSAEESIKECSVTAEELACESIELIKGKNLNVDRLDYVIRDLKAVNRIFQPEYSSILNNLIVDKDGKIKCQNIDTARLIFNKFIEANVAIYFDPKAESAAVAMATILRKMLDQGLLVEEDFFTTDEALIAKIVSSPFKSIFEGIGPNMLFSLSEKATNHLPVLRKLRFVNPMIMGMPGYLTDHCEDSKARLNAYLETTATTVYYDIPLLNNL